MSSEHLCIKFKSMNGQKKAMKAVILCAGYATRLYPLTLNIPKPLLLVGGKPVLEHILENFIPLAKKGKLDEVIVVTNDKFHDHFNKWKVETKLDLPITVLNDGTTSNDDRLGAVGDLLFAIDKQEINDDVMLVAGDNLFSFDVSKMHEVFTNNNASVIATYDLKDTSLLANKFGVVEINKDKKIIGFEEKPPAPKTSLTATAIYMLTQQDVARVQTLIAQEGKLDNMGSLIIYLTKKSQVYTYPLDRWIDIGSKEDYEVANKEWKS